MSFVRPLAVRASLAAALVLSLFLTAPVRAQALDQVPENALVVMKVRNLEDFSKKLAAFATKLGLDQQEPKLKDPLSALAEESGMGQGLNRAGDLVVAFTDPDKTGGNPDQSIVVLVPTSDYKAFLGNLREGADAGNGVTSGKAPKDDEQVFVANWGKYAAVSPNKDLVSKKPVGIKLTGFSLKESDGKDVLLYTNIKAVRDKALPELKNGREQMLAQIKQGLEGEGAGKFIPLANAAANTLVNIAEQFLKDAHSATIGLSLTDAGISATMAADFEPTSYMGKIALQTKPAAGNLLSGLPDRKYFFFGGGATDPELLGKLTSDLLDPIIKELKAIEETAKFATALEAAKQAYGAMNGWSIGYVAPTGELGQESVLQQVSIIRGDSKTMINSQRTMMSAMTDFMKLLPQQENQSVSFELQPDAKTIAGVKFDAFETKMNLPADDPQAANAGQMLKMMYGPKGMTGVMGAVDGKTVVTVQGGDDELITDLVTATKANADTLSARAAVRAVSAELPKVRSSEFYFDMGTLVGTGIRYARGFGTDINVKVPADLPPIGFASGTDATAVRLDMHVPTKLIEGMMSLYLQAQREMGGGNNNF